MRQKPVDKLSYRFYNHEHMNRHHEVIETTTGARRFVMLNLMPASRTRVASPTYIDLNEVESLSRNEIEGTIELHMKSGQTWVYYGENMEEIFLLMEYSRPIAADYSYYTEVMEDANV